MEYRTLANSNIKISVIGFGSWAIAGDATWGPQDESEALDALKTAYDEGITFFDTAEMYGKGLSEQLLAKALKNVRGNVVIATKVTSTNLAYRKIIESCNKSLLNLGTDYIDLYQIHWPSREVPFEESIEAMEYLKSQGKIRAYGISNFGPVDMQSFLQKGGKPASNQIAYNLLFRAVEFELLPILEREKIPLLCYSPLMQGLLTGKFNSVSDVPEGRARTRHFNKTRPRARHREDGVEEEMFKAVESIREIADNTGYTPTVIALSWLISRPMVASVITGARSSAQVKQNASAGKVTLPEEIITKLNDITALIKEKLGHNLDMWQSDSRIR